MPKILLIYVRWVEAIGRLVGRATMYGIFLMIGVLLFSSLSKLGFSISREVFPPPPHWTLEVSQFMMVGYFLLGGAYSMQLNSHVRMDLAYGALSDRARTWLDVVTILFLIFYVGVLLYGGFSSTGYALEYGERSSSAWRPQMAPIKIIMCFGIALMLLQSVATLIRDVAKLRGTEIS